MEATIYIQLDSGEIVRVAWTEIHEETRYTAIPSLLRALADAYENPEEP